MQGRINAPSLPDNNILVPAKSTHLLLKGIHLAIEETRFHPESIRLSPCGCQLCVPNFLLEVFDL